MMLKNSLNVRNKITDAEPDGSTVANHRNSTINKQNIFFILSIFAKLFKLSRYFQ